MPEKIDAFLLADRVEERTDFAPEAWNGSLSGLSQECFEFAEDLLDRIEIGGVLGQIECGRTRGLDRFRHTGATLWDRRLSMTTTSPRSSVGARHCWT